MSGLLEHLKGLASDGPWRVLLGEVEEREGSVLAAPTDFSRAQIARKFAAELRAFGAEVVVDTALAAAAPPLEEPATRPTRRFPPGVVAKLLVERGYWSLSPTGTPWVSEDVKGTLSVEPGASGAPGVSEAIAFTGLVSIWAHGPRVDPVVETSLSYLAAVLGLTFSGQRAKQLRTAIERLKTTTYRATLVNDDGGIERLFSILDEIQTTWTGPPSSPHRHVRAVFSRTTLELLKRPKMLRPIDLGVLRELGPQRDLARRLFLFLEASTAHPTGNGVEVIERIVDDRLAATLGTRLPSWKLAQQLRPACTAIEAASDRYRRVEITDRRKQCLRHGEPRLALRVIRRRLVKAA